jgi:hypothetical protein
MSGYRILDGRRIVGPATMIDDQRATCTLGRDLR